MKYKSVNKMIRAMGIRTFRIEWILSHKEICVEDYQDLFRVYLDEYDVETEI